MRCPSSISFLLSASFFRDSTFSITFWNRGIISSLAWTMTTDSVMQSFFFYLPKEFTTSTKKPIVGNYYKYWMSLRMIFRPEQLYRLAAYLTSLRYYSTQGRTKPEDFLSLGASLGSRVECLGRERGTLGACGLCLMYLRQDVSSASFSTRRAYTALEIGFSLLFPSIDIIRQYYQIEEQNQSIENLSSFLGSRRVNRAESCVLTRTSHNRHSKTFTHSRFSSQALHY